MTPAYHPPRYACDEPPTDRAYLHMPVAEGKRDRTQLEALLPRALRFAYRQLSAGRTLLVHCAQGRDRSVAVTTAILATFFGCGTTQLAPFEGNAGCG